MHYTCPVCNTENNLDLTFHVEEYVCKSCSNLVSVSKNTSIKVVKKPIENVVLEVGQIGFIEDIQYTVVAIIVRKYGTHIFWREYFLKDQKGNEAFLSESDGHWVFLVPIGQAFKDFKHYADFEGKNYRWYETTLCSIHAVTGFFEDQLDFKLATYKEFVNGTEMVSSETSSYSTQYFKGKHISKNTIKKAFSINDLPNYYGVGIVQPFYINIKQAINILCIVALFICLLQFYVSNSRTNYTVLEQTIEFKDVQNKELVSKSFTLSGGSAPMNVDLYSGVDNSWANIQLSLVNESTSETTYASKDIEKYSGVEGGESWTEGSTNEEFNICGVAPGKYHFVLSAEKQAGLNSTAQYSPDVDYFKIKAIWLPVSFWNFTIIMILMIVFFIACYWGKYMFNVSKWKNSSNSPYPQS